MFLYTTYSREMDIIFVCFNSEKWIDNCFKALAETDYALDTVNVFVVDNKSKDNSLVKLENNRELYKEKFKSFNILEANENLGFGRANNLAFHQGNSDVVLFLNIDTEIFPDALYELAKEIEASPEDTVMWELRQFPYEHPKIYDPVSMEVSWCSGAAFAVRRNIFKKIGGFDERIFMYAEDVDLSWRLRSFGYKLHYCPRAAVTHYSYEDANEIKPNQYINSIINNLMLRYRFGKIKDRFDWYKTFFYILRQPNAFWGAKKLLVKRFLKAWKDSFYFRKKRQVGKSQIFEAKFVGFDYETIREGAFYKNRISMKTPLVSIIVRTCGRPSVLRETLISLRNQTYRNIEIIVVEDGKDISKALIQNEFSDLNILYYATGEKVGRSKAGNLAMEKAHGKYLNFLDDDDVFYADHVEVLVYNLENTDCKAAYAMGYETPIEILSKEPYKYKIHNYLGIHKQSFNKIILSHHNYIPIQCIMFDKMLFKQYGGLDESLDALEDWDLWVRYSLHTDFKFINKTTSLYRVPYNQTINSERQKILDDTLKIVRKKHEKYIQRVSVFELAMLYEKG